MDLALKDDESELLRGILQDYVSDLRLEIRGTDSYTVREALKEQENTVKRIIFRLERSTPVLS